MFTRTERLNEFVRYYPIISVIIGLHLILFVIAEVPFFPGSIVFEKLAGVNLYIAGGEIWRLVTPMFLHSGFAHLLFNSFSLIIFGPGLERMLGSKGFALVYLATGILANLATFFFKPLTYIHVGSSGAIFGLFGVYVAMILFRKEMLSRENRQIIILMVAIGMFMTFFSANVNMTAHLFGLISGILIGSVVLDRGTELVTSVQTFTKRALSHSASPKRWSPVSMGIAILVILALIGLFSR